MFGKKAFGALTLAATLLSGTASFAVTTDQVWADWQKIMTDAGARVTAATEAKDGDDLRLNGVTITYDDGAKVTMAEVMLTAEGDGSVMVMPMDIAVTAEDGVKVGIAQEGLMVTVHEDAGGLGYGIMASMLEMTFDDGGQAPAASNKGTVRFDGLDGRYERGTTEALMTLTAQDVFYDLTTVDPSIMLDQFQSGSMEAVEISTQMTLPEGVDLTKIETPEAFGDAVRKGLAFVGEIKQGASVSKVEDRSPMFPFTFTASATGGTTGVDLSADGIKLGGNVDAMSFVVPPGTMPTEITGSLDGLSFEFAMPVLASTEPGDYVYQMALKNLVLADSAWALFDPTGALPRTPADLEIDLGGTAKLDLIALMAASENGEAPASMPELLTMDITALTLKLAGAAFTGNGAFTFDNSMVAFGGPPMPIGKASIRLEGGNRMIDALIAMGMITNDDATGFRAMMGAFGRPAGDDVLTSEIEAKEGGSITVNGLPIQ